MPKRGKQVTHFVDREMHDDDKRCPYTYGPRERIASRYAKSGYCFVRSQHLEDIQFDDCKFVGANLVTYGSPQHRSSARRVRLNRCSVNSFSAKGAILEDIVVDGLRVSVHPFRIDGCALRHVVLSGVGGRFLLSPEIDFFGDTPETVASNAAFAQANAEYYKSVDWALDISKAKVACFEIRGAIPPHLIIRNPDEQFLMSREVALSGKWKKYKPPGATTIGIDMFIEAGGDVELFVCGSRSTSFKEEVEYFQRLKAKGLVS